MNHHPLDPALKARARAIAKALHTTYPDAACELLFDTPLELLVATILSAQCTDERVNQVTRTLFRKYRTASDYADAPAGELEHDIRSTGFFNNKARALRGMGRALVERHAGEVPRTMDELLELPGVARKTANVVLGSAFHIASGMAVDTHVHRLARRLGLSDENKAEAVEQDLLELFPSDEWIFVSHAIIWHGRRACHARKPQCAACALRGHCPSAEPASASPPVAAPRAVKGKKVERRGARGENRTGAGDPPRG